MRKKPCVILLFAIKFFLLSFKPPSASGHFYNTGRLLEKCEKGFGPPENVSYQNDCVAYISGVSDAIEITTDKHPNILICLPDKVNNIQLARVVLKYLKKHPKLLNYRASDEVFMALVNAFPCKKDGQ